MPTSLPSPVVSRATALRGWAMAAVVYLLAVLHRTSLGVAGLAAQHRFSISPGQLSVFVLMQLGVYAAMQVPTGVLVDRYGPRRLLIAAALIMGSAQLLFAVVPSYPAALAARALLGFGDAMTFISVLRYAASHFSPRRYPLLVALTAMVGTVGNVAATLPLSVVLHHEGWGPTFGVAGCLSVVAAIGVCLIVKDPTPRPVPVRDLAAVRAGLGGVTRRVAQAWSLPGTRLGFWVHAMSMSTTTAFGVLWAGAYLTKAGRFSSSGAGLVLMAGVLVAAVVSPIFGAVTGRHPAWRVPLGIGISLVTAAGWLSVVFLGGDRPSQSVVAGLFVVMALGGPASMAAFALARDYNGPDTLGTASGVVNVGGFVTAIGIALGMGAAIDLLGGTTAHALRLAALVAVAGQLGAATRVVAWYRRVRHRALIRQAAGQPVPVPVAARRWWDLAA